MSSEDDETETEAVDSEVVEAEVAAASSTREEPAETRSSEARRKLREQMQAEIDAFLRAGGRIQQLEPTVSAQAAPLLQPYQASGQIYAMLSGLVGGRAYEEMTRRPAVAGAYWSAYQVGLALAVLVILLGGLLAGGGALLKRAKTQNQARG